MELIKDIVSYLSFFDLGYLIITLLSLIKCTRQGFVLSILAASKWLFAYIVTLFLFPKIKPYINGLLDNEYVLDVLLGISIFIVVIFIILLVNRSIKRAVRYTGLGNLDKIFGFFFWIRSGVHNFRMYFFNYKYSIQFR